MSRKQEIPGRVVELDPARVKPFAEQPRKRFRGIPQLAESIRTVGQVTPIVVTSCEEPDFDAELVDGERRLRACLLGQMRVRATFDEAAAEDRFVRSIAANFCRQDHDAVEIMEAVCSLLESGKTHEQIASMFGKTTTWAYQYASLRKLAPEVLEHLKVAGDERRESKRERRGGGRMTLSLALLLVSFPHNQQRSLLKRILAAKMSIGQARTMVAREASGEGVRSGNQPSHYSRFKAVSSAVENCSNIVERYLRLPGREIGPLIAAAGKTERKDLAAKLERLCESLLMLSDAMSP